LTEVSRRVETADLLAHGAMMGTREVVEAGVTQSATTPG